MGIEASFWRRMVFIRNARHVDMPPPQYRAEVDERGEGVHGDAGGEVEGDELVDSDYEEIEGEDGVQRAESGRVEGENARDLDSIKDEETFQINLLQPNHSCPQIFGVKNVKTNWLKDKYLQKFKSDPKRCVKGFRVDCINKFRINVSKQQAYRAKKAALKEIEGAPEWQYSRLWDYSEEIRRTNPGSTVVVGTEDYLRESRFRRFYICFGALKRVFKAGCRPIIGVDGCHLKGPHGGILLTAVGVDPNNNLFPIAYAVVDKECRETWEWFLIILKHDLEIIRDYEYTFMSDKQKGLMQAFGEIFPGGDHRYCVRHLHNNFKFSI
ncbi:UNVERIFIED_CONTAM: hypothetical protein Sradi_0823600 [Sesamum radiatum]|uniref:MULE transposase domain-containing protein n=1 Tax=Sesamum radiatum TaxID=300843 RepID=A0AAW2VS97_SESRA